MPEYELASVFKLGIVRDDNKSTDINGETVSR